MLSVVLFHRWLCLYFSHFDIYANNDQNFCYDERDAPFVSPSPTTFKSLGFFVVFLVATKRNGATAVLVWGNEWLMIIELKRSLVPSTGITDSRS